MHQQLLCAAFEKVIAKALSLNLSDTSQLTLLEGKALAVTLTELGFPLLFTVNNKQILVTTSVDHEQELISDCTVNTSIKTLIELKKSQQLTELIKQDKLDIIGDIKVAQQFAQLAETLNIDWQSELAKHIGDVATYKLGLFGKLILGTVKTSAKQIEADATEWLVHEKRLIVTQHQVDDFNQQVNEVAEQTLTLSTRIEKLLSTVPSTSTAKG